MTPARWASFLIAIAILLASATLYQSLAVDSEQMEAAALRVAHVPRQIGPWHGIDEPPDEAAFAQAGAKSYWVRTYVHQDTKASLLVILMCGRAGKMAVHAPEVCYHGAGYELHAPPTPFEVSPNSAPQFWTARFDKRVGRPGQLRLYWGWNAGGHWQAAPSPRWQFRGEPFLYKLYVSHEVARSTALEADPTPEFLRAFVPAAQNLLFPS